MSTLLGTEPSLAIPPVAPSHVYNEAFEANGQPRPAWREMLARVQQISVEDFSHRSEQAQRQLYENGVTYNVFHEGTQSQRPWRLDLLPVMFSAAEWSRLDAGLRQRARLLNWIARDCHGDRTLIHDGSLPPEVLFANPGFVRAFVGLHLHGPSITCYAAELARSPDGTWRVMADRADSPAGAAFALENRIVVSRTVPPSLHEKPFQRLAPFFLRMQNSLRKLGSQHTENPRIVLLSPGEKLPYYFEDVYLARYLGYSLVEGADLAVRDDRVFLKTLAGLVPIDVIVSRGIERGIDPLELGGREPHGVPGLLRVLREGKVAVANTPGAGLVESPIFMASLPSLCRRCLGEDLILPSIATWWCGDPQQFRYVRERFLELVIKPAFQASGSDERLPRQMSPDAQRKLLDEMAAKPHLYVAQELIARSSVPVFRDGQVKFGHLALRTFAVADDDDYSVMPGGLVRVAPTTDPMELSISAGEGSKDLWVLSDGPVAKVSLLTDEGQPVPLRRTSAIFPSRVADDLFWFGQSLDRADFLSRLLRSAIERLTTESLADSPELPWLIHALADQGQLEPAFAINELSASLPALADALPRMVADLDEARGLAMAVSELSRLASLERLWMSPDSHRKVRETARAFLLSAEQGWTSLVDVLAAVNQMILDLAAVSGLIHDGMIRGPAWRLLDIGRRIERTRDTAALLRSILSSEQPNERAVWKSLLEVIDCRMTYRSRYLDNLQQNAVLDLCLTDETCPRSIVSQLIALADHVEALPADLQSVLRTDEKRSVMATLHAIRMISEQQLADRPGKEIMEIMTSTEQQMKHLSDVLTRRYLLHSGAPRQITSEWELPQ